MPTSNRLIAFDGVRGMAALVVTLWHIAVALAVYLIYFSPAEPNLRALFAQYSVINFEHGSDEPVEIFFILSGFALAAPVLRAAHFSWRAYYPSRILRLYLPVLASLVFANALLLALPRATSSLNTTGSIFRLSQHEFSWAAIAKDVNLFGPAPFATNIPLWTLGTEVLFSLALPLYIWLGRHATKRWQVGALGALALSLSAWGRVAGGTWLTFLPLFMLGVLLAFYRGQIAAYAADLYRRHRAAGPSAVAVVLFVILWWHFAFGSPKWFALLGQSLSPVGGVGILVVAYTFTPWRRFFDGRTMQYLGKISFSLYLTHVPVLLTLCYLLGPSLLWLAVLLALPTAVGVADLFYRVAEAPLHNLSQRLRRGILQRQVASLTSQPKNN